MTALGRAPRHLKLWAPSVLAATWFGAGLLPRMPGTWGALAALPFAWVLVALGGPWLVGGAAAGGFAGGLWAAARDRAGLPLHDPGQVVIDEVAAQWLTLAFVPLDPMLYLLGFLFFRIADVGKIWPASWLDRRMGGAIGVMLDDLVAAVYAGGALWLVALWYAP